MILTSIPSPPESVWHLGPLPLRAYAIAILIGIFVGWLIADRRYRAKGGPDEVTIDAAVWMVIIGIIGARLYHVITSPDAYFGPAGEPLKAFRIWEGGLGIWGGVAFGAVAGFIYLHRRNLRFGPFADALVPGLLLGQAIGRLGNWFNQELFGKPTDLPWALKIDASHMPDGYAVGTTFHPTFLYELIWCSIGAALLIWAEKQFRLRGGQLAILYVIYYTAGRLWIEMLRIDEAQIIMGLRLNVWTSIIILLAAIVLFMWYSSYVKKHPELADIYLRPDEKNDDVAAEKETEATESAPSER